MIRLLVAVTLGWSLVAYGQTAGSRVAGTIAVHDRTGSTLNASDAVVWLAPRDATPEPAATSEKSYRLVQKNKRFLPHLLVVPVDAIVEFPNEDDFFHNVFSIYEGTRFDLGLYESGSSKKVRFSRPGAAYIFCNIHPSMSAVVMVLQYPYYAVTNSKGEYVLEGVPPGEYVLNVWFERAKPEELKKLSRFITVAGDSSVPPLVINASASLSQSHKNKYGQDYEEAEHQPY